ncbi:MAG TPA: hypothetical protein VMM92_15740 [Thermoanaerobaculia bacterium]|nr:hypothetical protein [Thermoanaerobaculia bacterium]
MKMKSKTLVLAILLVSLALPALADHHQGPGVPNNPVTAENILTNGRLLARFLGLSSSQVTELNGFLKTLQTAEQAVRQARPPLCKQLATDLTAASPDATTVGKDLLALVDNQDQIKTALEAFDTSFSAILTPDQLTKYDALKQVAGLAEDKAPVIPECPPSS